MNDGVLSGLGAHCPTFLLNMAMTLMRSSGVRETRDAQPMYRMEYMTPHSRKTGIESTGRSMVPSKHTPVTTRAMMMVGSWCFQK